MAGLELILHVWLMPLLLVCHMESHGTVVDVKHKQGMNGNDNTIHGKERLNDCTDQEGHDTIYGLEQ